MEEGKRRKEEDGEKKGRREHRAKTGKEEYEWGRVEEGRKDEEGVKVSFNCQRHNLEQS